MAKASDTALVVHDEKVSDVALITDSANTPDNALVVYTEKTNEQQENAETQKQELENAKPGSPFKSALVEKVQKAMADRLFNVFVKVQCSIA